MIKFTSELTNNINGVINGINKAADIITSTMGGSGKNVVISNTKDDLVFTKDGVSVAKFIRLPDNQENIGAQLLINAANKTVESCGDGTTLTSLFVKDLTNTFFKLIDQEDINKLIDDANNTINQVCEDLIKRSKQIVFLDDIYNIAFTSTKSQKLANFIKTIYSQTGFNANISLEYSRTSNKTYFEITKGLNFESGIVHPGFFNTDYKSCVFEKALILLEDKTLNYFEDYIKIIEECYNQDSPLVIIAPAFSDAFVRSCLSNKSQKGLKICLIKSPGYGSGAKEDADDIISFINNDGSCNRFTATSFDFTIYNNTDKDKIKKRTTKLSKMASSAIEGYDEKDYLNRISKLEQTSAIIYVGGFTDKNAKEEYDRIEDAIGAIKSAFKLGYVKGAGVELASISNTLLFDENLASKAIKEVLLRPYYKILDNANYKPNVIYDRPYNTRTKTFDDNIIDPTHVVINALTNSFALVELLINTSYIVFNNDQIKS